MFEKILKSSLYTIVFIGTYRMIKLKRGYDGAWHLVLGILLTILQWPLYHHFQKILPNLEKS